MKTIKERLESFREEIAVHAQRVLRDIGAASPELQEAIMSTPIPDHLIVERPAEAPASSGLRAKAEKVVNQWEAYVTIKDRNVKFAAEGLLDDDMKELRAALSCNLKDR